MIKGMTDEDRIRNKALSEEQTLKDMDQDYLSKLSCPELKDTKLDACDRIEKASRMMHGDRRVPASYIRDQLEIIEACNRVLERFHGVKV